MKADFREGSLDDACDYQMVMLIPKEDEKEFRGTRLVEVLWKAKSGIVKWRLIAATTYHYILHGFWMGRGTGTLILEAKLLHYL